MKLFRFLCGAALLLAGCEKSIENYTGIPVANNDTIWAVANTTTLEVNKLQQNLIKPVSIDSFSVAAGSTLQTSNGLQVDIAPAAFGQTATGNAQAELALLRSRGDLIRFAKSTVSASGILQNVGSVYINITKNNQPLSLQNGKVFRLLVNDSLPQNLVKGYSGEIPTAAGFSPFTWQLNDSLPVATTTSGYQLMSNRQQWINLAVPADTSLQQSRVVLSMPSVYTNCNTLAFIIFRNQVSVVQFAPDATNRIWLAQRVPTGKRVLYLTITKQGTDYWLGTQEVLTTLNQNIHITPERKSLQAITSYLDSL